LADGEHIHIDITQAINDLVHFFVRLTGANHHPALGYQMWSCGARARQQFDALLEAGAGTEATKETRYSLDIMIENIRFSSQHRLERFPVAVKIGDQNLDLTIGHVLSDQFNRAGEDRRAAIGNIVAVDRCQDSKFQP
jgi:hypothetical protein